MQGVAAVSAVARACLGSHETWAAVSLPRTLHVRGRIDPAEVFDKGNILIHVLYMHINRAVMQGRRG